MTTLKSETYTATRITVNSSNAFDRVLAKLYSSIGDTSRVDEWNKVARGITSYSEESKEKFIESVSGIIGPHEFMIFKELDHGSWIPLYNVGSGLKVKRIILGNPLIAITMLKHDINAGLFVPVEVLVKEIQGGGTEIIYNLPSGLIAGLNRDEKLVEAAEALDRKLEVLLRWSCE